LDQFIRRVQEQHEIDWAGKLAGYPSAYLILNGLRCLVTLGVRLINPVKGDPSFILDILMQLLPDGQHHYVLARHKLFIESIRRQEGFRFSQAFVIVGDKGCGKSLLLNRILTPLTGGRQADATGYLNGNTQFNDDLGYSESWAIDDAGESKGFDRRTVSDGYKRAVVDPKLRIEGKHIRAINVEVPRLLTVLSNAGNKNVNLIPELSDDINDKVTILLASKVKLSTQPGYETNVRIAEVLPASAWYIENEYQIPDEIRSDDRFGIKAYHHSAIVDMIKTTSPSEHFFQYVTSWMSKNGRTTWSGTHAKLYQEMLADSDYRLVISQLCKSPQSLASHLRTLAKRYPTSVHRDDDHHDRDWAIVLDNPQEEHQERSRVSPQKIIQAAFRHRNNGKMQDVGR
jgi:hypothetical protein